MGRHANGRNNWRLSRELTIGLIAIVVIVSVILWWTTAREDTNRNHATATPCINGTVTLPIQAIDSPQLAELIAGYEDSDPVVRDYCVEPQLVSSGVDAALTLASGPRDVTRAALEAVDRTPASDTWPIVFNTAIGVAHTNDVEVSGADWTELADRGVVIPAGKNVYARAVAASALTSGDIDRGVDLLRADRTLTVDDAVADGSPLLAVTEDSTPDGYTFYAPDDLAVSTVAIPLTATDRVSEEQTRAAADFARYVSAQVEQAEPDGPQRQLLSTADIISERFASVPEESKGSIDDGTDTLVLLDTSTNMDALIDGHRIASEVALLLDPLMLSVGRAGGRVALWNYSSPLSPGVTRPWRENVTFLDDTAGVSATKAVKGFGTGGDPMTRTSVLAALGAVSQRSTDTGQAVRFVIITSGTADTMDDRAFRDGLTAGGSGQIIPQVVHVGTGPLDPVLAEWATSNGGTAVTADMTVASIADTLQDAFGVARP
ncbi:hypothetical protein M0E87_10820 [Corynebacterium sp. CCM 9185]|uniref:VWFA domain-containing protein n=1 Tax=Corynebacterium marambiense TaxID=2765364 RepID=A0ABS0VUE8_9CORY|nr:hypothetical protein [Corynebacterium marambiense]MBI9000392.1 hypothetical protein [Corynebacterium marambiense]MCK7664142.1 hypothetical protein [Corynebacterium marambiense]MCX7543551.1 hypothetical protein [Corynebacterium marambiense]